MKTIRKSRAKETDSFADSAVIDIDHGAHLKMTSVKDFPPKFHGETGDFWNPTIATRNFVVDDRTEEGDFDGAEFTDYFPLKMDLDVQDRLGITDEDLKNGHISEFTREQQQAILDEDNWTIRDNSKAAKLNTALFGKDWTEDRMDFHPDQWIGKEFIAKVYPRTGKRPGSYCGWDTFISVNPPKKKKKRKGLAKAQQEAAEAANQEVDELPDLSKEEERQMNEAIPMS